VDGDLGNMNMRSHMNMIHISLLPQLESKSKMGLMLLDRCFEKSSALRNDSERNAKLIAPADFFFYLIKTIFWAGGVAQVVEYLLSKRKALSSNPIQPKINKQKVSLLLSTHYIARHKAF
jgi:hypothetical protein